MYLVARPLEQAEKLINFLSLNHIEAEFLPIMGLSPRLVDLPSLLDEINACSGVLFSSPATISYLADSLIQLRPGIKYFSVGASSARRLQESGVEVVAYNRLVSGVSGLIQAQILTKAELKSLAVIGGEQINQQLAGYLSREKINYKFIDLYRRDNIGLDNLPLIAKLVNKSSIVGIIITSSQIAAYFSACVERLNLRERVNQLALLCIHPQISDYLSACGFRAVYHTSSAADTALLTLIRKLEDE